MNFCSKINGKAEPNTVAIGGDLHQMAKGLRGYSFQEAKSYSVGFKLQYPIFAVTRNESQYVAIVDAAVQKTLLDMGRPVLDTVSSKILKHYGYLLTDCYERPQLLRDVLRDIFGNSHADIINTIKTNLGEHAQQKPILRFMEKISECDLGGK